MDLCLASKSPRRRRLLLSLGVKFDVLGVDVPEIWDASEDAEQYVSRVAAAKARAAAEQLPPGTAVLSSDTEAALDSHMVPR